MLNAVHHGGGIPKTAHLRSLPTRLHHLIKNAQVDGKRPPTPQDIIQDSRPFNTDIFNLISWIIDPRAPIGEDGMVKISSKRKSLKIQQISRNLVSLMPSVQPSLDQVLLSLILHRKTGSREVVDTIHRLGYGFSYTQTLFIEDKWAEWDRGQNSSMPANITRNAPTAIPAGVHSKV